jgi:hypothetical protein
MWSKSMPVEVASTGCGGGGFGNDDRRDVSESCMKLYLIGCALIAVWADANNPYPRIKTGMTPAQVIAIAGPPNAETIDPNENCAHFWGDSQNGFFEVSFRNGVVSEKRLFESDPLLLRFWNKLVVEVGAPPG